MYLYYYIYICTQVLLMHMHMSCYHFLRQNTRDKAMSFQSTSKTCFSQLGDHTWYICVCVSDIYIYI